MDKKYYYKVEIEIDEEKVIADHKYKLDSIYKSIRNMFLRSDNSIEEIVKEKTRIFITTDPNSNDATLCYPAVVIAKRTCYKDYITKLLWYDNDEEDGIEYCEDVLNTIKTQIIKGA